MRPVPSSTHDELDVMNPTTATSANTRERVQERDQLPSLDVVRSTLARLRAEAGPSDWIVPRLSEAMGVPVSGLAECLGRLGVEVVVAAHAGVPRKLIAQSEGAPSLTVVTIAARHCVVLPDPWDEAQLQRACAETAMVLEPIAAPQDVLRAWTLALSESEHESPAHGPGPGSARGTASSRRPSPAVGSPSSAGGPKVRDAEVDVVAFVDGAIGDALDRGASDVHFECDRAGLTVRLRMDGVLETAQRLEGRDHAQACLSRIKVMAQLDITETRVPQDGRMRWDIGGHALDVRVSVMPCIHGEDAVLRLLDKRRLTGVQDHVRLETLGFAQRTVDLLRGLAQQPSGMVLVTGPTGSGKTTTVYAALAETAEGIEKIITIEDPVEYELPGVLQIPVHERKGLTFAKGLRSILRHDPDKILVGEIRDSDTAEIAVQSALTGHLVFTTVHANAVADVIGRFRHFGLDMFGFMSALNGVIVQRLLRSLCAHCPGLRPPTAEEQTLLGQLGFCAVAHLPVALGCPHCRQSGYSGRHVVAEVHVINDAWRDVVLGGASPSVLRAQAAQRGEASLLQLAVQGVLQGRTTMEEVRRVVGFVV